jgi:hypothetical protein
VCRFSSKLFESSNFKNSLGRKKPQANESV